MSATVRLHRSQLGTKAGPLHLAQCDIADAMVYVEAGDVKLTVLSKRGKKAVIAIFRQGDFFGEAWERRHCACPARWQYTRPSSPESKRLPSFASFTTILCSPGAAPER